LVPKRVKVENSYISSVPAALAEYSATNVIPPVGAIAAVKNLCYISQFASYISQGQKSAVLTSVNLGPRHISDTITARKLKFYVPLQRVKYTFGI